MNKSFHADLSFLALEKITDNLPGISFNREAINFPKNIQLADTDFNQSKPIEVLLGASIFWSLMCVGQIKCGKNMPVLQKTHIGWILSGPISLFNSCNNICNLNIKNLDIQEKLEKFWKLEECPTTTRLSQEELECEEHFKQTTSRGSDGKFIVSLPIKATLNKMGESKDGAIRRLYSIEKRLSKNEKLKDQYHSFMKEYIQLGDMSLINENDETSNIKYYMLHHCVIKESSLTIKCRVVFDASAKTSTGLSLNDVLKTGPDIQDELFSILLRFRCHNYVFTGDIEKMYRMVNIKESERDLQRIVWRFNPDEEIKQFRLNTITYGTAPASFIATRVLHQIAQNNSRQYPEGSRIILRDFYVDDLITGASTIEEAQKFKCNISAMLSDAGFILRKWASNDQKILEGDNDINLAQYFITDDKT
uniref:Uncharacterized protein LOC114328609 n=1 Tax=Diabrotica virgifera virgifera TaxID=50390 RepID=A0A6P7FBL6_DIAVI